MTDGGTWVETFEAPVEEATLDLVQDRLEAFWTRASSVGPTERVKLELAIVEIVGNIIEHAFVADSTAGGRVLSVVLKADADSIEAVISDNGLPTALDLGSVTMPDEDAVSGRGLALTMASVDELRYERVDGRNRWTLRLTRQTG